MCWDEKTSWTTFIIGTTFNILTLSLFCRSKNEKVKRWVLPLFLLWEFVLLMQVFDALGWRNPSSQFATKGAMIANITQPLLVFLVLVFASPVSAPRKQIALILMMAYLGLACVSLQPDKYNKLAPAKGCKNIDYSWWKDIPAGGIVYTISIVASIFLLIDDTVIASVQGGFILLGLVMSMMFYRCGTASVWCWMAAFAPLLNCIMFWILEKK